MPYCAHNLSRETIALQYAQVKAMVVRQPGITPRIIALQTNLRSHEAWTVCYALRKAGEVSTAGYALTDDARLFAIPYEVPSKSRRA